MATTRKTSKKTAKAVKKTKAAAKKPSSKKTSKAPATKKITAKPAPKKPKKSAPAKKVTKPVVKKKPTVPKKVVQTKPAEQSVPSAPSPQPSPQKEENQTQEEPKKGTDKYSIDVLEGPDNRYFVLTINSYRNFFALEEMRHIVKACHQANDEQEGMQRLYHWFKNFRQDVINNTKIEGPSDPALATIYNYIVSTYTVKGS